MNITCEYCGAVIGTKEEKVCSNCGASYENNKEYLKKKKENESASDFPFEKIDFDKIKEKIEQNGGNAVWVHETQETVTHNGKTKKTISKTHTVSKSNGAQLPYQTRKRVRKLVWQMLIALIALLVIMPLSRFFIDMLYPDYKSATANFNEKVSNGHISVICDEIKEVDLSSKQPFEGYRIIAFHFVITNELMEEQSAEGNVSCVVDGITQYRDWHSSFKNISTDRINGYATVDGWALFQIPIDAEFISIGYGRYITINILPENIVLLDKSGLSNTD